MNNGKTFNINDSFQSTACPGCKYSFKLIKQWQVIPFDSLGKRVTSLFCPHYMTKEEYGVTTEETMADNQLTQTIFIG